MNIKLKKQQRLFFRIALAALLVWIVVMLLDHTIATAKQGSGLNELHEEIKAQEQIIEQLEAEIANIEAQEESLGTKDPSSADTTYNADSEFYLEQYARDRGYSYSGEMIFIETPGS